MKKHKATERVTERRARAFAWIPQGVHTEVKIAAARRQIDLQDWFAEAILEKLERDTGKIINMRR